MNRHFRLSSSAEDKGFEPSTGYPAPDFESGLNAKKPCKNKAFQNSATYLLQNSVTEIIDGWESLSIVGKSNVLEAYRREVTTIDSNAPNKRGGK